MAFGATAGDIAVHPGRFEPAGGPSAVVSGQSAAGRGAGSLVGVLVTWQLNDFTK